MEQSAPTRIALIGTSRRSASYYGPLVQAMPDLALVAVWGRSVDSARKLGETLHIPWYTDVDQLIRETQPQIGIVSVSYGANGQAGLMAVEHGLHVLLETPIAHKLTEADAIIEAASLRNLKIEIAEQFHRRPLEQIKLQLIASGLLGHVHSSFSDFAGHGYHGISVMRSYLGFDAKPIRVIGSVHEYPLGAYYSRLENKFGPRSETQEHGIIEFENGKVGIFHWTSVGYDSPLRWWRSSRFLAEKGMAISVGVGLEVKEQISLLAPGGEAPHFVTIERRWERVDGGALEAIVAHTGDLSQPIIRWDNPFKSPISGWTLQWHDDEIGVASCIKSLVDAVRTNTVPSYGPLQGRLDQELITAIRQSAATGGQPVILPLNPAQQTH